MIRLFVSKKSGAAQSYELEKSQIFIGRSPENDVQIDQTSVSRRHLKISKKKNTYFITDLRSTNGTYINGSRITPDTEYKVSDGLPVVLGKVIISLGRQYSDDAAAKVALTDIPNNLSETGIFTTDKRRPTNAIKNLELIYNVANVLMQSLDINELLEKVLDNIFNLLKRIDRGAILLVNPDTSKLENVISRSKYESGKRFRYSTTITEKVLKDRKPVTIQDMDGGGHTDFSDSMMLIKSVMCVPLISRSQIRGVIYVDSIIKSYGFRQDDLSLLTSLCSPAAIAIENALLYSNLEQKVEARTRSLRQTEKKLRESETRFKAIFDNMSSGVIVYSAVDNGENFILLDLNRAAQRIEKIAKKQVLGKSVYDIFPAFKKNDMIQRFQDIWKTGKPKSQSLTISQKGEITGWREYYIYCLLTGEIVTIFDDVTDKRKAEVKQKRLQEQLYESQKMEAIGTLAGGTAHNFRNILQAISGNIEYLEMVNSENREIAEMAKNIDDSITKGVDLINNLLHFSKRGGEPDLVDLDLAKVIENTYEITEKVFNKNIKTHLDLEKNLMVKGNQSLLSQVFMNLFTNARDAMPNGGELRVEAGRIGDKVITSVSDTGHGIDKDTLDKIFDPFFTLKDVGKGTGLGLATCLGIIEQHNGKIMVTSKPGKGTKFNIQLSYVNMKENEKPQPEKNIVFGKGQKVLIVDDEPAALTSLTNLVNRLGYEAISFSKPLEAIANYDKFAPDIILMDRSMPEMDGIACIKEITKTDSSAKVIIISGYEESGPNGIDTNVKKLIKGYLTKPCGLEQLSHMLAQALN